MTDKQLSALGERLYTGLVAARLTDPALTQLMSAVRQRRSWSELDERAKISVFVVAAKLEGCDSTLDEARPLPNPLPPAAMIAVDEEQAALSNQADDDAQPGNAGEETGCASAEGETLVRPECVSRETGAIPAEPLSGEETGEATQDDEEAEAGSRAVADSQTNRGS
jgi:hypothetical protein